MYILFFSICDRSIHLCEYLDTHYEYIVSLTDLMGVAVPDCIKYYSFKGDVAIRDEEMNQICNDSHKFKFASKTETLARIFDM